jgi:hypothetical protein
MPPVKSSASKNRFFRTSSQDGARNSILEITGELIDGDFEKEVVVDPETLWHEPGLPVTRVRVDSIDWFVPRDIVVELLWEGEDEEHSHIAGLTGRGHSEHEKQGGKQQGGHTPTGRIILRTEGFSGERRTFSFSIELVKQFS